jgi:hypothetical protein
MICVHSRATVGTIADSAALPMPALAAPAVGGDVKSTTPAVAARPSRQGRSGAEFRKFAPEVRAEVIRLLRQIFVERAAIPAAARPNP